ncbi:sterol desaturase family protein [Runella sp.]|uniref:sterol desaturase family protein n=1 Tax=Runella sp. TaxID=1960881 RepID=UPI003D0C989A
MVLNVFAFAVPLFLFFIALEYYIGRKTGKIYHQFNESVANLNVGIAERLIDLFTAGGFYFVYDYLHRHFALFDIKPTFLLWVALLLATDLLWYWYHRFGHGINLFWAAHIVHHQSEDFNLTTGTRITILQAVVRTGFWAILPIIGFPADMITSILIVHGLYPFFTHTQLVGKLGVLEYILVTPSHHRVHHAANEIYLDKNFGDMFIIWDKLFGTFAKETEPPAYGLTKPLKSYSFMWQHFHYFVELGYALKQQKGILKKLKVLFGSPADFDPSARLKAEKKFLSKRKVRAHSNRLRGYVFAQMAAILVILFLLLLFEHYLPLPLQIAAALFIVITLINSGAILEQRRWVFYLEYIRASILLGVAYYYYPDPTILLLSIGIFTVSLVYEKSIQKKYLRLVYG